MMQLIKRSCMVHQKNKRTFCRQRVSTFFLQIVVGVYLIVGIATFIVFYSALLSLSKDLGTEYARQLRRAVESTDFPEAGRITISLGVGSWHATDDRVSIVQRTDKALYKAKEEGRNRTVAIDY